MSLNSLMSYTSYAKYANYVPEKQRRETYKEMTQRVMGMHRTKYAELAEDEQFSSLLSQANEAFRKREILGSQRALQFGGPAILQKEARIYNCASTYIDRCRVFGEIEWALLCGCGVGFSVQKHHVANLPDIAAVDSEDAFVFEIPDSIEGWADAISILMASYFVSDDLDMLMQDKFQGDSEVWTVYEWMKDNYFQSTPGLLPKDVRGKRVVFDYSKIRPEGAKLSWGGSAPGPEGLRNALEKIRSLIERELAGGATRLRPIDCYDIVMHASDAVLSGGVRRCLPEGSKVHTKKGLVNIEDVEIGTHVLTSNGYHPVTNKFDQGVQDLVRVQTQDSYFDCTPNHKIAVLTGEDVYEWKRADELEFGDRVIAPSQGLEGQEVSMPEFNYTKPLHSTTCKDIVIPELDEDMAWLLGLIQGDGYVGVTSKSGEVYIPIHNDQNEIGVRAETQLRRFGISVTRTDFDNYYRLNVKSKQLGQYLHNWLKQPNTELEIPDFIYKAKQEIKLAFVAGIMDADGSCKNKPVTVVSTVYESYARSIQKLLSSCGVQTRVKALSTSNLKDNWQPKYAVVLINTVSKEIFSRIPQLYKSNIKNTPGQEKHTNSYPGTWFKDFPNEYNRRWSQTDNSLIPVAVVSVDELNESKPTWDLEVDEAHEFFCEGYLMHNSATICIFSVDDLEMAKAKIGDWYLTNPQRARSNNSACLLKSETTYEEFKTLMEFTKQFGEPGFIWMDHRDIMYNPCFSGDTYVFTKNATSQIKDIVGKTVEVKDANGEWVETQFRLTGKNQPLLKVTLSNNAEYFVTHNHKFMLKDGSMVEAVNLNPGDALLRKSHLPYPMTILSVEETDKREDVYCCSVPTTGSFVMPGGWISGNCVEIGKYDYWHTNQGNKLSGFQFCNLSTINMKKVKTEEDFVAAAENAAIIGTLQAGYTKLDYLGPVSEWITKKESLLGVSMTGMTDSPEIAFNPEAQRKAAQAAVAMNKKMAELIGIPQAARVTCVKPEGSSSCLLGTASGIHPHHSKRYFRRVQANKTEWPAQHYKTINPAAVEDSVWSANGTDVVVNFLCEVPQNAVTKKSVKAVDLLENVVMTQNSWVAAGKNAELCSIPELEHNVSNTITVRDDEWDEVTNFIYENRESFAGISLVSETGDLDYRQAPFCKVSDLKELIARYGEGSVMASGLIVDGLSAFNGDLWTACDAALGKMPIDVAAGDKVYSLAVDWDSVNPLLQGKDVYAKLAEIVGVDGFGLTDDKVNAILGIEVEQEEASTLTDLLNQDINGVKWGVLFNISPSWKFIRITEKQLDWLRRAYQFALRYFNGDVKKMTYCLKEVNNFKVWCDLQREHTDIDWSNVHEEDEYLMNTAEMGAQACAGGKCEI